MKVSLNLLLTAFTILLFISGCAQKVTIKALNPAEVGAMASKKNIAISSFKNDSYGLSGKIESNIAKQELENKKYFNVLSRRDLNKVLAEQKLQSSELMNEATATKVGKLIGAQAVINGEIASASAETGSYKSDRKECISYYKDGGCANWRYYKVICNTTQASVAANINIVNVETGSIIYGDTLNKEYNGDSCKSGSILGGLLLVNSGSNKILSKGQALNRLTTEIANEFVYKLTPHYIYFSVSMLDKIELDNVTDKQEKLFENSLLYIKAGRMDKAEQLLQELLDQVNGKSYVVAYAYGIVNEAQGKYEEAKKIYAMADNLTIEPVDEINAAVTRIDSLIYKREQAKRQINAK
jgi:curli biogenesis system outer membrane secretion channel CsgG